MFSSGQIELFTAVNELAERMGVDVFIVGGMIRDLYLKHDPGDKDVDFIVVGEAIRFAEECTVITGGVLKRFPDFNTAKIRGLERYGKITEVDFASSRKETYTAPGKLPVVELAPISEDLRRRDFSINALAVKLPDLLKWSDSNGQIESLKAITVDYYEGIKDLENLTVRVLHENSFRDDPTRIFRAVRYAARIKGRIEQNTFQLVKEAIFNGSLECISKQRIVNELKKILEEPELATAFKLLNECGAILAVKLFLPEREEEVVKMLSIAKKLAPSDSELVYQTALRIFHYAGREQRPQLGLGANELKKIDSDIRDNLDLSQKQTVQRLSKAGLLFQEVLKTI